jgi:hypothetical protein
MGRDEEGCVCWIFFSVYTLAGLCLYFVYAYQLSAICDIRLDRWQFVQLASMLHLHFLWFWDITMACSQLLAHTELTGCEDSLHLGLDAGEKVIRRPVRLPS